MPWMDSYASCISRNCFVLSPAFWSGWCCLAFSRYAFLISFLDAPLITPVQIVSSSPLLILFTLPYLYPPIFDNQVRVASLKEAKFANCSLFSCLSLCIFLYNVCPLPLSTSLPLSAVLYPPPTPLSSLHSALSSPSGGPSRLVHCFVLLHLSVALLSPLLLSPLFALLSYPLKQTLRREGKAYQEHQRDPSYSHV